MNKNNDAQLSGPGNAHVISGRQLASAAVCRGWRAAAMADHGPAAAAAASAAAAAAAAVCV